MHSPRKQSRNPITIPNDEKGVAIIIVWSPFVYMEKEIVFKSELYTVARIDGKYVFRCYPSHRNEVHLTFTSNDKRRALFLPAEPGVPVVISDAEAEIIMEDGNRRKRKEARMLAQKGVSL